MTKEMKKPLLRKPLGVFFMILLLAMYAIAIVNLASPVLRLPALAQAPIWLVLGVAWVLPMLPLIRWIETGRFRE